MKTEAEFREVLSLRYILLLRGINVGGKNKVVMHEFIDLLAAVGLEAPASYMNSGNLFFSSLFPARPARDALAAPECSGLRSLGVSVPHPDCTPARGETPASAVPREQGAEPPHFLCGAPRRLLDCLCDYGGADLKERHALFPHHLLCRSALASLTGQSPAICSAAL